MEKVYTEIDRFLKYQSEEIRPIVCVTSGGTIVPLSTSSNPFIDNFSLGERGANSVEYFLANGYVVIFLYRVESRFPFSKNIHHHYGGRIDDRFLSNLVHRCDDDGATSTAILLRQSHLSNIQKELIQLEGKILRNVIKYSYFLPIAFRTIEEYLGLLEYLGKALAFFGPRVCFYLAAAVSDFYIPSNQLMSSLALDKNNTEDLVLPLQQVPKMLGLLTREWAPNAYVVSFKLETDQNILLEKARKAIDKYAVHLVVANLLHTRRDSCVLVAKREITMIDPSLTWNEEVFDYEEVIRDQLRELFIERQLIDIIIAKHENFIKNKYERYFQYRTPASEEEEKKQNRELLRQLLQKIFREKDSLICRQIHYYLKATSTKKDASQSTSPGFEPWKSTKDLENLPTKIYNRRYSSLIGGVSILVAVTVIKLICAEG